MTREVQCPWCSGRNRGLDNRFCDHCGGVLPPMEGSDRGDTPRELNVVAAEGRCGTIQPEKRNFFGAKMSAVLSIKDGLRPLSELKVRAGELVQQVQESGRPLVITRHGRSVAVLVSVESFERYQAFEETLRIRRAVQEGLADVREGRTTSHEHVLAMWEERLAGGAADESSVD